MHKVKINQLGMRHAEIIVDGLDIARHVAAYTLTADVRNPAVFTVEFTPDLMPEWDGLAEVRISEELAAVLVLFGWQPPVTGEVTETEITALGQPNRVFLRSDGTYRTEPWHVPEPHTHRASCHGEAGELFCGKAEA